MRVGHTWLIRCVSAFLRHRTSPHRCGATESPTRRHSPAPATFWAGGAALRPVADGTRHGLAPPAISYVDPRGPTPGAAPWYTRPTPWWTPACTSSTRPTSRRAAHGGATLPRRQRKLFGLVGIYDPSLFVRSGPVFAREVIVPTAGHSLAPLLNYWELTSLRRGVKRLHDVAPRAAEARPRACWGRGSLPPRRRPVR